MEIYVGIRSDVNSSGYSEEQNKTNLAQWLSVELKKLLKKLYFA